MSKNILLGILGIVAVGALLIFFLQPTPQKTEGNITINETIEEIDFSDKAEYGDLLSINYVLSLENDTIVDTNNEELAKEAGLKNYVKGDFTFILGQSGKIYGFDNAIVGMKEGEHKDTIIEPSEKELILKINKTKIINRFVAIPRNQDFSRKQFEKFFKKAPITNDIVFNSNFQWKFKVLNFTEDKVRTQVTLKEGDEVVLPNTEWKSRVASFSDKSIMMYMKPEENQTITTDFGPAVITLTGSRMYVNYQPTLNQIINKSVSIYGPFSVQEQFQVTEITDEYFQIERIGLLADKRLKLSVDLLSMTKGVKTIDQDKPHVLREVVKTPSN